MEKLNDLKKPKHEHKGTDILKVLIFSLVMLAPFFAILSKCLYTLNPNAKDSYYGETINEFNVNIIDNTNELNQNTKYYLSTFNLTLASSSATSDDGINVTNIHGTQYDDEITKITFYRSSETRMLVIFRNSQNTNLFQLYNDSASLNNIDLNYVSYFGVLSHIEPFLINGLLTTKEYNDYSYIDNVFYYATKQLGNEQLFSWTKSTAIYGAVNGLTSGMGIDPTNNVLAILITYWSLTTAVYVVMDIVIELFKKLTHLIN